MTFLAGWISNVQEQKSWEQKSFRQIYFCSQDFKNALQERSWNALIQKCSFKNYFNLCKHSDTCSRSGIPFEQLEVTEQLLDKSM